MKILLAIDGSAYSEAAIDAVIQQFHRHGTEVRIIHAVEWLKEMPLSYRFGAGPEVVKDILAHRDQRFRAANQLVANAVERLQAAGFTTSSALPDDDPKHAILECADEWQPDLIVMGSHGSRGLNRFLLGSVSESVMHHAGRSVQIVRLPKAA